MRAQKGDEFNEELFEKLDIRRGERVSSVRALGTLRTALKLARNKQHIIDFRVNHSEQSSWAADEDHNEGLGFRV